MANRESAKTMRGDLLITEELQSGTGRFEIIWKREN